jgi:hypothetical protein
VKLHKDWIVSNEVVRDPETQLLHLDTEKFKEVTDSVLILPRFVPHDRKGRVYFDRALTEIIFTNNPPPFPPKKILNT